VSLSALLEDLSATHTAMTHGTHGSDGSAASRPVPAATLRAGQCITIGRYRVQLVEDPTPAPRRVADGYREVTLLVREVPASADHDATTAAGTAAGTVEVESLWSVTVGADQLFTPL
jgi:hypothetical protein